MQGLRYLSGWADDSGDKEEFLEHHPRVRSGLDEHDQHLAEVMARCNELFEQISRSGSLIQRYEEYTTPEALNSLREAFPAELRHQETPDAILSSLFGTTAEEKRLQLLAQYIISDVEKLPHGYTTKPFWDTYGDRFRMLMKYPPILHHADTAEGARAKLLSGVNS